jgi:hypothetical protein
MLLGMRSFLVGGGPTPAVELAWGPGNYLVWGAGNYLVWG